MSNNNILPAFGPSWGTSPLSVTQPPASPVLPDKFQKMLDTINSVTLDDLVTEQGNYQQHLNNVIQALNTKSRLLADAWYRSPHYRRYNDWVRDEQDRVRRNQQEVVNKRLQWLKDNIQIGDWIQAGGYSANPNRRVVSIMPDYVEVVVGDVAANKATGRTVKQLHYAEIFKVYSPEAKVFKTVPDVSGI